MDEQRYAGLRLVQLASPFLERKDRAGLAEALEGTWSSECLALLLSDGDSAVVRAAAICLGLVGEMEDGPALAKLLQHADAVIVEVAEDALWSIWFRAGGSLGQAVLSKIAQAIREEQTENVVGMLTALIGAQKDYAEAYHQRSQAHYLRGAYDEGLRDARRAVELNPLHFGALANLAHCLAALGRYPEALEGYRQVLSLHPRMPGISSSIRQIREHQMRSEPARTLTLVNAD